LTEQSRKTLRNYKGKLLNEENVWTIKQPVVRQETMWLSINEKIPRALKKINKHKLHGPY